MIDSNGASASQTGPSPSVEPVPVSPVPASVPCVELIERLDESVGQLRRMMAASDFGGPETAVRVKDPSYLVEILGKSRTALSSLSAEKDRLYMLAKANNDLARMNLKQADDFRVQLTNALEALESVTLAFGTEACRSIARRALASATETQRAETRSKAPSRSDDGAAAKQDAQKGSHP